MNFIVQSLRVYWPNLVVQDADSVAPFSSNSNIPYNQLNEIFIYLDHNSYESWSLEGAIEENLNKMIHVIEDEFQLTLVVDDVDEDVNRYILDAMDEFSNFNRQRYYAMRNAA